MIRIAGSAGWSPSVRRKIREALGKYHIREEAVYGLAKPRAGDGSCLMRVSAAACLFGITVFSACSSTVVSKAGLDPAVGVQMGNAYSGVRLNLKSWRCLASVAEGYSPAVKLVFLPVSALLLVIDVPVSVAADTLMLPIDLTIAPRGESIRPLGDECN